MAEEPVKKGWVGKYRYNPLAEANATAAPPDHGGMSQRYVWAQRLANSYPQGLHTKCSPKQFAQLP